MNSDIIEGKWTKLKGAAKIKWGKLSDDDLNVIDGKKDKLVGTLQERYGMAKEEAEREVHNWDERDTQH